MTFNSFKDGHADESFKDMTLTEDSLRLALAKLGSKSDRKRNSGFGNGSSRSSHGLTRRKFAKEDSVVVEKLPSRNSNSLSRSALPSKVRSLAEEKLMTSAKDFDEIGQQLTEIQEKLAASEKRQNILENHLAAMQEMLQQHEKMLTKERGSVKAAPPLKPENDRQKVKQQETELFTPSAESAEEEPIPLKLKEDAAPVEWWKH